MIECRLHTSLLYRVVRLLVPLVIASAIVVGVLMVSGLIQSASGVGWLVLLARLWSKYGEGPRS